MSQQRGGGRNKGARFQWFSQRLSVERNQYCAAGVKTQRTGVLIGLSALRFPMSERSAQVSAKSTHAISLSPYTRVSEVLHCVDLS